MKASCSVELNELTLSRQLSVTTDSSSTVEPKRTLKKTQVYLRSPKSHFLEFYQVDRQKSSSEIV